LTFFLLLFLATSSVIPFLCILVISSHGPAQLSIPPGSPLSLSLCVRLLPRHAPSVHLGPSDLSGVLSLEEEGLGLGVEESEGLQDQHDRELVSIESLRSIFDKRTLESPRT
jgi:hypothetical protein